MTAANCYYWCMRERLLLVVVPMVILTVLALAIGPTGGSYRQKIVDVSWPNCKAKRADFGVGVVGVTGGLDFHPNTCAGEEAGWFSHYAVYMNTGYPGHARGIKYKSFPRQCRASDNLCLGYNYGYNAALYAINYAASQNVHATSWWLDVELENSWTDNFLVNRQFVQGAAAAIKQKVWFAQVGIYSSHLQWNEIMGPWQNKLPTWWATGTTSQADAAKFCRRKAFTGGQVWLSQYTIKYDQDLACSDKFVKGVTNAPPRVVPPLTRLVTSTASRS